MDGGSTTAAETTLDTQAETETENKEGTSIKTQMLKNAKTHLALDEEFDRQETELQEMRRARVEESENSQREEVSLVSYSDSELESIPCSGIESVKHTEEADTSDLEEEAMLAHDNLHGITGGDREGPYSPPSPLNMEREE